ncbi:PAS domain-containing protein [Telluribacter sp. SYSU D00476]|uniref:PAS domain-containing protein n=1 Tax=Telluribacter sp. SYSU D00476 TaxID=2811430 RepID=UPI001FF6768E|nr:PAS domain-containing protein [Telluribacter sp. SYSU D00476]
MKAPVTASKGLVPGGTNGLTGPGGIDGRILDSLPMQIAIIDCQHTILYINETWRRFIAANGVSEKELVGADYLETYRIADRPDVALGIRQVLVGEQTNFTFEFRCPVSIGAGWMKAQLTPVIREDTILALTVTHQTSTETQVIEPTLPEVLPVTQSIQCPQQLDKVLETIREGLYTVNRQGVVTYWNKGAEAILGTTRDEALGKNLWHLLPDTEYPIASSSLQRSLTQQISLQFEEFSPGTNQWLEVSAYPFEGGLAVFVRDITARRQSEEQLRIALERYDIATQATNDAVWDWDLITGETYRSEGFKEILGLDASEIIPNEDFWLTVIHPEDLEKSKQNIREIIAGSDIYWELDYRVLRKSGGYTYVKDRGKVLRDAEGKAIRMVGAIRDIFQNHYYLTLEKLERDVLQMNAIGGMPLADIMRHYMREIELLHPGMICSILEVRNNRVYNLASPSLPPDYRSAIEGLPIGDNAGSCGTAAFRKEKVIVTDIQNDFRWKDYKSLALQAGLRACWSQPVLDSSDNVMATFACYYTEPKAPTQLEENTIRRTEHILQVILESSRTEEALKETNKRYELVTKVTNDIIWDWDIKSDIIYWSTSLESMIGMQEIAPIKTVEAWATRIHPEDIDRIWESHTKALGSPDVTQWKGEYRMIKSDGTYVTVLDRAYLMRDKEGTAVRMIGALQDISQQKEQELEREQLIRELSQTNQDLRQFSFITSHNFRAPLSNLMGLLKLMEEISINDPILEELIQGFNVSTSALNDTVNDLIDVLIIKGNPSKEKSEVRVKEIFDKIYGQIRIPLYEANASVEFDDSAAPVVLFDRSYLESIFMNLLTNSLKYRSYERRLQVSIRTQIADDSVLLIFRDNGIGMDLPRYRNRLFGLYQCFHERPDSKGLGLYLVKSQIEALGGTIEVESEVNVGTTFTIALKKEMS